jgi:hypothetical protein
MFHELGCILAVIFLICVSDRLCTPARCRGDQNARWFAIHTAANAMITILCLPDVARVFDTPTECSTFMCPERFDETTWFERKGPSLIGIGLHLYHVLFFTNLTVVDWVHHLVSAFLCGAIAILFEWGSMLNFILFFLTGLPGGIDYGMLFAVKMGYMDTMTEKWINTYLNLWMRMPGLVASSVVSFCCIQASYDNDSIDMYTYTAVAVVAFSNLWNGIYFCGRVVGNYNAKYAVDEAEKMNASWRRN